MIGYLRYRSVLYWMNAMKNRESFCMNPAFFATAETFITREEAIAAIRNAVPEGTLLWLQTHDDSHEKRLDFTSRMQDVLCTIWNHAPSREALRGALLTAARKWLTLAESEGVEIVRSVSSFRRDGVEFLRNLIWEFHHRDGSRTGETKLLKECRQIRRILQFSFVRVANLVMSDFNSN